MNVQVILEPLGGGGHLMMAGAQLHDCTLQDAETRIREQIDIYRAAQAAQQDAARVKIETYGGNPYEDHSETGCQDHR